MHCTSTIKTYQRTTTLTPEKSGCIISQCKHTLNLCEICSLASPKLSGKGGLPSFTYKKKKKKKKMSSEKTAKSTHRSCDFE